MLVIAFIPVRGGSKSIPLKNIKPFCGKPLVCWNIEALENCPEVSKIVVATDSDAIMSTVEKYSYRKVQLYRRLAENACDTASTESVMLEYIHKANLPLDSVFMLVQATSPLTETIHFTKALQMYAIGKYDSILSCVRNYRFFWTDDGKSLNYDYTKRPRRQDFNGILMENGAFYINNVGNILANGNRIGGNIGIYEMPEYTSQELDEPDDWMVLEHLMCKHILPSIPISLKDVKLFLSDVDGTLTDGGMYYSEKGDELKKFNTRDGMGMGMLKGKGVKIGIITSENLKLNQRRAMKLNLDYVCQGKTHVEKLVTVMDICDKMGINIKNVAYIGDDINCIDLLSSVGYAACPSDADPSVKSINGIRVMKHKGGEGCVREFCDYLLNGIASFSY